MRKRTMLRAMLCTVLLFPSVALAVDEIAGVASVIDGDTLDIQGQRIRLNGIDAPESRQTCQDGAGAAYRCGAESANALAEWLSQSRPTICAARGKDRYSRIVATCFRADGKNVNAWLVANGLALDWPRYSKGRYAGEQDAARAAKRGIWRGSFIQPWEWRNR